MNIGVFFGGKSPEHDVSIITGQLVISELKKMGKDVTPVYIGKDGQWYVDESLGQLKFFQRQDKEAALKECRNFYVDMEQSQGKVVLQKKGLMGKKITIDLAFPAFHGSFGEDGTIQGLFEMLGVPYVGCDVASSAIAADKVLTKRIYQSQDIPTTAFVVFDQEEWDNRKIQLVDEITGKLSFPIFVKPPLLGSSIGITKAGNKEELEFAIEVALHYGRMVLVEEGVTPLMDVTCCLIGNEDPQASLLQESLFSSDLFDFEEKYLKEGGAQLGNAQESLMIPARLDEETTQAIQEMAKRVYKLVGCSGIARVDFLYNKDSKAIYANEINPLPGTIYHHLWKASGIELSELLNKLITFASERHEKRQKIRYTFESDILKNAGAKKLQLKGGIR